MKRLAAILAVSATPTLLAGQTAQERAQAAVDGVVGVQEMITTEAVEETVIPYETDTPPESQITDAEIEDEIEEIRNGDGVDSQILDVTEESALSRPTVEPAPDALDLADSAVISAEDVLGGLFTGNDSSCEAEFVDGVYQGVRSCNKILGSPIKRCTETREISVDRRDSWSCLTGLEEYQKTCRNEVTWQCNGKTGTECFQEGISLVGNPAIFAGYPLWDDDGARIFVRWPWVGGAGEACQLRRYEFRVKVRNHVHLTRFYLRTLRHWGAAQIKVNGQIRWTSGGSNTTDDIRLEPSPFIGGPEQIWAGNDFIADCSSANYWQPTWINMLNDISRHWPGPSDESSEEFSVEGTQDFGTEAVVEITVIAPPQNVAQVTLDYAGGCCSAFQAQWQKQC